MQFEQQHDYILNLIQKFMIFLRALIKKETKIEQQQEMDKLLKELSELDQEFFLPTNPVFPFLPTMLKLGVDENKKAMICILLAKKDSKVYEPIISSVLETINLANLDAGLRVAFLDIFPTFEEKEMNHMLTKQAWFGVLEVSGYKQNLKLDFQLNEPGLEGVIELIDQGQKLPPFSLVFKNRQLTFHIEGGAFFEGEIDFLNKEISGSFTQAGQVYPLTFRQGALSHEETVERPQTPKPPFPYREVEVTYENTKDKVSLSGTLTLPKTKGPHPVVLLIAGSGRHKRNEEVFGHKPFLVLADYLTKQGIAVLRFDKRGVGNSTGDYASATSEDFAQDVLAGIEYLKARDDIAKDKIVLLGHSEGSTIASMIAARNRELRAIVLLGAPGANGGDILLEQAKYAMREAGISDDVIKLDLDYRKKEFDVLRVEEDLTKASEKVLDLIRESYQQMIALDPTMAIKDQGSLDLAAKAFCSPWMRFFLKYNPDQDIKKITIPTLVLTGELDTQVMPKQNLPVFEKALEEAGNPDFLVKELPKLNHLLQTCTTGSINEYGKIEETISPVALELISEWLLKRI